MFAHVGGMITSKRIFKNKTTTLIHFCFRVHFLFLFSSSSSFQLLNSFSYLPSTDPSRPMLLRPSHPSPSMSKTIVSSCLHSSLLLLFLPPFHLPSSVKWERNELTLRAERMRASGLSQENDPNRLVHFQIPNPLRPLHHHQHTPPHNSVHQAQKILQWHRGHGLVGYWSQSNQPTRQLEKLPVQ